MDALRKQIQSLVDHVLNHCFWTHAMIARIKLLWKPYLVCSHINERYDIRPASFTLVFEFFCIASNLGALWLQLSHIFESSQLGEFSTDLQDSGL